MWTRIKLANTRDVLHEEYMKLDEYEDIINQAVDDYIKGE